MALELIEPKIRGFICTSAHPLGCAENVRRQVEVARQYGPGTGIQTALIIGASAGYGLGSRIAAAFGWGAETLGVSHEKSPAPGKRTASAGWYNTCAFHEEARRFGKLAVSLNGDAFSDSVKAETIRTLKANFGPVDLLVYSLAAPRRTNPRTGITHSSVLKPVGETYASKTINLSTDEVEEVSVDPANEKEVADTVAVMGGEDWRWWVESLADVGLLAPGFRTTAYSYVGPEVTARVYRKGAIGAAKLHLEKTARELDSMLQSRLHGNAWVSVLKGVVTQASAAIPVVPLYMSILLQVMKEKGINEGPIEQACRLFRDHLNPDAIPKLDGQRLIRLDDLEMRPDVQSEVARRFALINTQNLREMSDYEGFRKEFRQLFGFEVPGVDYAIPVETDLQWQQIIP